VRNSGPLIGDVKPKPFSFKTPPPPGLLALK